jgi:hypothetical protein
MKSICQKALCAALTLLLTACGNAAAEQETETSQNVQTAPEEAEPVETEEETVYVKDSLPESMDLQSRTITTFGWSGPAFAEFYVEEQNGEVVNDAIYSRNRSVEERLNITLAYHLEPGSYDKRNDWVNAVRSSITAGDGAYDITAGYSMAGASLAAKGMCLPLNELEYLDFSKPWWPPSLMDEVTCGGKMYVCSGDISTYMIYYLYGVYFNQELIGQFDLENPYDLVQSGEWTVDKLSGMAAAAYIDLNGDGTTDFQDSLGYTTTTVYVDPFYFSCGLHTTEKDENDIPHLAEEFSGEKAHSVVEKVVALVSMDGCLIGDGCNGAFKENRALFISHELTYAVSYLREAEFTYGIIPYPKYDEMQEQYVTITSFPYSLYSIPIDTADPDVSALVMEALASEGYRTVSPALFENAYKVKYARDTQSSLMYDLIRSTVSFDFGRVFNNELGGSTYSLFRDSIVGKNTNWISKVKGQSKVMTKMLDKLVAALTGE